MSLNLYPIEPTPNGFFLFVRLTPKSAHERIQGIFYDTDQKAYLKVTVMAPPVDGKANDALIKFLSKKLKCAISWLSLAKGHSDRKKTILIENLTYEDIRKALLP